MLHSHRRGGDRREGTQGRRRVLIEREDPREHCWSVHNRFGDLTPSYRCFVLTTRLKSEPTLVVFVGSFANESSIAIVPYSIALGLRADERYDTPDDKAISFTYVHLSPAHSQMDREPPNFFRATAE